MNAILWGLDSFCNLLKSQCVRESDDKTAGDAVENPVAKEENNTDPFLVKQYWFSPRLKGCIALVFSRLDVSHMHVWDNSEFIPACHL
jgi:hypothetical protein